MSPTSTLCSRWLRTPWIVLGLALLAPPLSADEETLENSDARFTFEFDDSSFALISVENLDSGSRIDLLPDNKIWAMTLRDAAGTTTDIDPTNTTFSLSVSVSGNGLTAIWSDVEAPGETLDVTAEVTLSGHSTYWNITATPQGSSCSIYDVSFPNFSVVPPNDPVLTIPSFTGAITHDPMNPLNFVYLRQPGLALSTASMQFFSLYDDTTEEMLYLATRDPLGYLKDYSVRPDAGHLRFEFIAYPENHLVLGNGYQSPYCVEVGALDGRWFDAAAHYKQWAEQQPFTAKGKLFDRAPSAVRRAEFFIISNYCTKGAHSGCDKENPTDAEILGRAEAIRLWKEFLEIDLDRPALALWRSFEPIDGEQSPYMEAPPKTFDALDLAETYGGHVSLYWRAGVWQYQSPSYIANNVEPTARRDEDGDVIVSGEIVFTEMIHDLVQTIHQDKIREQQVLLGGFHGLYIDILTGLGVLDYNSQLPSQGGGHYTVTGMRTFLDEVQTEHPAMFTTAEYANEHYADTVDVNQWNFNGALNTGPFYRTDHWFMVPMYQAVFHQYQWLVPSGSVAAIISSEGLRLMPYLRSETFDAGSLTALNGNGDIPFPPDDPRNIQGADEFFAFLKLLHEAQSRLSRFYRFGERVRPLDLEVDRVQKATIHTDTVHFAAYYSGHPSLIGKVFGSAWRSRSGDDLLLSLVNWWDSAEPCSFDFRYDDYGLESGDTYYLIDVSRGESVLKGVHTGDFQFATTVAGLGLETLLLTKKPPLSHPSRPHRR